MAASSTPPTASDQKASESGRATSGRGAQATSVQPVSSDLCTTANCSSPAVFRVVQPGGEARLSASASGKASPVVPPPGEAAMTAPLLSTRAAFQPSGSLLASSAAVRSSALRLKPTTTLPLARHGQRIEDIDHPALGERAQDQVGDHEVAALERPSGRLHVGCRNRRRAEIGPRAHDHHEAGIEQVDAGAGALQRRLHPGVEGARSHPRAAPAWWPAP